jgi:hypothetical protein
LSVGCVYSTPKPVYDTMGVDAAVGAAGALGALGVTVENVSFADGKDSPSPFSQMTVVV